MEILPESVPRQKKDHMLQEMDGEILLYHAVELTATYMNPSAAIIWQLCDGQHTVQMIVDELMQHFPDTADLSHDVNSALHDFLTRNLVEFC